MSKMKMMIVSLDEYHICSYLNTSIPGNNKYGIISERKDVLFQYCRPQKVHYLRSPIMFSCGEGFDASLLFSLV